MPKLIDRPNLSFEDNNWSIFGRCASVDPDLMYPGHKDEAGIATAKAVCAACPAQVFQRCIEERTKMDDRHGVWGGMTPQERELARLAKYRRDLRRRRAEDEPTEVASAA